MQEEIACLNYIAITTFIVIDTRAGVSDLMDIFEYININYLIKIDCAKRGDLYG
jgi:hypothetical protein